MKNLDLAFSTCPNDTFIMHAMLHGYVDTGTLTFTPHLHDVEALNMWAFSERFHISKLSFYAYFKVRHAYEILDAGAALGYGCGPLLVWNGSGKFNAQGKIAIPGEYTTAYLLLRLWNPALRNLEVARFDTILEGVQSGKYQGGLIIHEGRFIYPTYGCVEIADLGQWWEDETGLPIPLGCIAVSNATQITPLKRRLEVLLRDSVAYGMAHRDQSRDYIKSHAQHMDDQVIDGHIDLYVNRFTLSLGDEGAQAVRTLEEMARCKKIL